MSLRIALRTLFKAPFVTGVAVLSLALGLGANSAIFSMFDQLLLRSLSVREPERLVNLASAGPKQRNNSCNQSGDCDEVFSYPLFRDLEQKQEVFTGIAAHRIFEASVESRGRTETATATLLLRKKLTPVVIANANTRQLRALARLREWDSMLGSDTRILSAAAAATAQDS